MFGIMGIASKLKHADPRARRWVIAETKAFAQRRLMEQLELADKGDSVAKDRIAVIQLGIELLDSLKV